MTKTPPTNTVGSSFSSKELLFLKTDSEPDTRSCDPPEEYISDLIFSKSAWMEAFTGKLNKADIPTEKFYCAVIRQKFPGKQKLDQDSILLIENLLTDLTKDNYGIWGRISDHIFVLAVWNIDRIDAEATFNSIKKRMHSTLNSSISMGLSKFPFINFSRTQTFHNAVKALDHAAFFGMDSVVTFDDVSLNISGDRLYQTGKIKDASIEYQNGLTINKNNLNLLNSLGVCYGIMGDLDKAKKEFENAIAIDENEVMAAYNAGLACNLLGNIEQGVAYLLKASQINNQIYEVEISIGNLLIKSEMYDQALTHLRRAGDLKPEASTPLRLIGDLFLENQKPEKAIPEFNQAIKLNPSDAAALSGLANAFEVQDKNLDIALTFAKESVLLNPANPVFRNRLGKIYLKKNQKPLADKEFEKAEKTLKED